MAFQHVHAALAVADLDAMAMWYATLLGAEPARPMAGLAEWALTPTAGVQLVAGAGTPGGGLLTLAVEDVEAFVAASPLAFGDAKEGERNRIRTITDPEGNVVTLVDGKA